MENKELKIKELLESVKDNPYAKHKEEIHKISMERGADVGTACAMLRTEKGWKYPEGDKDITAFTAMVHQLQVMSSPEENLVLDYFEGRLD